MSIAIIGGTGLRELTQLESATTETVTTRFGAARITDGQLAGERVLFVCRHGEQGEIPPHRIDYRAHVAALLKLGARAVLSTTAVGGLNEAMPPGSFVLPDQFLDFTRSRATTFFDESPVGPVHLDMTQPFCERLRDSALTAAEDIGEPLPIEATYACAEGPRFETPAEIRMMRTLGADLVGMTLVPEVALAREAGLCYANVSVVTNWAAGIAEQALSHRAVSDLMRERGAALAKLLAATVRTVELTDCTCAHSLDEYDFNIREFLLS